MLEVPRLIKFYSRALELRPKQKKPHFITWLFILMHFEGSVQIP